MSRIRREPLSHSTSIWPASGRAVLTVPSLPIGSEGTVRTARPDAGQIDVEWDNGSRLILLIEDPFEIIPNR